MNDKIKDLNKVTNFNEVFLKQYSLKCDRLRLGCTNHNPRRHCKRSEAVCFKALPAEINQPIHD